MPALALPADPPIGQSSIRDRLRMREVSFGDGYTQRSPDGLNHIRAQLDLKWMAITEAQKDLLINFFRERGGWQQITHDGRQWVCKSWTRKQIPGSNLWDVSARLDEDFAP